MSFAATDCGKIESSTRMSGYLAELIFHGQENLGGEVEADAGGSNGITAGSVEHIGDGQVRMVRNVEVNLQTRVKDVTYSVQLDSSSLNLKDVVKSLVRSSSLEMSDADIKDMNQCFTSLFEK